MRSLFTSFFVIAALVLLVLPACNVFKPEMEAQKQEVQQEKVVPEKKSLEQEELLKKENEAEDTLEADRENQEGDLVILHSYIEEFGEHSKLYPKNIEITFIPNDQSDPRFQGFSDDVVLIDFDILAGPSCIEGCYAAQGIFDMHLLSDDGNELLHGKRPSSKFRTQNFPGSTMLSVGEELHRQYAFAIDSHEDNFIASFRYQENPPEDPREIARSTFKRVQK